MDARNLIELLEATTNPDPTNIAQAEERLSQVQKKNWEYCHVLWGFKCFTGGKNGVKTIARTIGYDVNVTICITTKFGTLCSKSNVLHDFCSRHTILIWVLFSVCWNVSANNFFASFYWIWHDRRLLIEFHCSGSVLCVMIVERVCNDKIEMFFFL